MTLITVSNNVKRACSEGKPIRYREFIRINNNIIPFKIPRLLADTEIDIKGELSADAYTNNTFFGTFNMKMLKFEAENNIDYKGKEFDYYKEVNGESFKIGRFIVTEVKDSNTFDNVTVTAYDYGLKFASTYDTNLKFSSKTVTFGDVVREICNKCNVKLANQELIGENIIIEESPKGTDIQYGNIIAYAAAFQGKFATINDNDELEFRLENKTVGIIGDKIDTENNEDLITENDYFIITDEPEIIEDYTELDDKRDTRPITCVLVAVDEKSVDYGAVAKDNLLISKYGENWLKIIGNPLIRSTAKCQEVAKLILKNVKGFGYTAFESKYTFKPYFNLGDIVKIRRKDGTLAKSNILRIATNFDDITLQAPSIIKASVEYNPITQEDKTKDALVSIDKANGQLVLKATSDGRLVQAELNANANDGSEFNVKADNINFESYNFNLTSDNIVINSKNWNIESNGNMHSKASKVFNLTQNDLNTMRQIVLKQIATTDDYLDKYDINGNGVIDTNDLVNARKIINGASSNTRITEYLLNTQDTNAVLTIKDNINNSTGCSLGSGGAWFNSLGTQSIYLEQRSSGTDHSSLTNSLIQLNSGDGLSSTSITPSSVTSPTITQTSLSSSKKNFEKIEDVLAIIENTDIYKYNLLSEKEETKKHYGLVIGDEFNYSKEITSKNNDGVDLYSMISVCFQAIKQLNNKVKALEEEIEELKNENNKQI